MPCLALAEVGRKREMEMKPGGRGCWGSWCGAGSDPESVCLARGDTRPCRVDTLPTSNPAWPLPDGALTSLSPLCSGRPGPPTVTSILTTVLLGQVTALLTLRAFLNHYTILSPHPSS